MYILKEKIDAQQASIDYCRDEIAKIWEYLKGLSTELRAL